METKISEIFSELMAILERLRSKDGCPWDREQTHVTLKPALLEESYEVLEAIDTGDPKKLKEELGDLLLQVIFHSQIAAEKGEFTILEVFSSLKEKLIRRHPHVFAGEPLPDSEAVLQQRAKIKAGEKGGSRFASSLGELPKAMPALARAQRATERASHLGFDWPKVEQVWDKVEEEMKELRKALSSGAPDRVRAEMGDLLFSLVNLCRFLDLQAEDALRQAVDRFLKRFSHIEDRLRERGKTPAESSLEEMDALWEEAKRME